jgi:hypothetical protein
MNAVGRTLGQIPRNGWHETRTRIQRPRSVDDPNSMQTMSRYIPADIISGDDCGRNADNNTVNFK